MTTITPSASVAGGLSSADYDRVFGVLADCDAARDLGSFREALLESLGTRFGFRTTTFFTGSEFSTIWMDPDPLETRSSVGMLGPYQDGWHENEVFSSAQAVALLRRTRVASLGELNRLPRPWQDYLDCYLYPGGFRAATALLLEVGGGRQAVVGIFKSAASSGEQRELSALRLLAGPLNGLSRALAPAEPSSSRERLATLAPRHRDVARLVAEGRSNAEVARLLSLSEGTVKKYVSEVLSATRLRSRTQLALLVNAGADRPHW